MFNETIKEGGNVYLYERELLGSEDLSLVISRMILHLEAGLQFVRKKIENTVTNDFSDGKAEDAVEEVAAGDMNDDSKNE